MRQWILGLLAVLSLGAALVLPLRASAQGRPDCATVLRKLHEARGRKGSQAPDSVKIAEKIGTDAEWVERCAESYGRRLKHTKTKSEARDPDLETTLKERLEEQEYDEVSREEKATLGDHYVTIIENDDPDRKNLHATRNEDTVNEWEPYVTHEWEPNLGHAWEPFLLDDDHPNEE